MGARTGGRMMAETLLMAGLILASFCVVVSMIYALYMESIGKPWSDLTLPFKIFIVTVSISVILIFSGITIGGIFNG